MVNIFSRGRFLIKDVKNNSVNINEGQIERRMKARNSKNSVDYLKKKKILRIGIVILIAVLIAIRIIKTIEPTMDILCIDIASSIATKVSNEQASSVMTKYDYDDISKIVRDEQGAITLIQIDTVVVNKISSEIALKIQNELENQKQNVFYIKLGTFTGTKILSGRGPNVPIIMSSIGNVRTDLVSEFNQAGINQTLHRIYLNVSCNVTILTPYDTIEQNIQNKILIAEAAIVGNVPNTYYNIEGISGKEELIDITN